MKNLYASCPENKEKALNFIKNMQSEFGCDFFVFSVIKDGQTLVKCALPPYDTSDNAQVYSLSKSFCSTAAGFAYDEGLWKPSDKITDIFPEHIPNTVSENLAQMTMGDVLSMSCGHENCAMSACITSDDPIKAFMEKEVKYKPGTHFAYNTGATFTIAAMVEKLTGEPLIDYLDRKLFSHLGVRPQKWQRSTNMSFCKNVCGTCEGGVGLYVSLDCIEAFGNFLLNDGVVNGKRLISHEWLELATSRISDNSLNGTKEWSSGYGYQFWMNAPEGDGISHGGFRGDGAFGQLCMVFPEHKTVISCRAKASDMQKEVDGIVNFAFSLNPDTDNGAKGAIYESDIINSVYAPEKAAVRGDFRGFGKTFNLCDNHQHFTTVRFEKISDDESRVIFSDGENFININAPCNKHSFADFYATAFKPTLLGLIPERYEEVSLWSSLGEITESTLTVNVRFRNGPHKGKIICTMTSEESVKIFFNFDTSRWLDENELSVINGNLQK